MTSPTRTLRQLCMAAAGLSAASAPAQARPRMPECVPEPPSFDRQAATPVKATLPGIARDLVMADRPTFLGTAGQAFTCAGPDHCLVETVPTDQDLVSGSYGGRSWAVDAAGAVFVRTDGTWSPTTVPLEGRAVEVASWHGHVAVRSHDRAALSFDDGASWQTVAAGGEIDAMVWSDLEARLWLARADGVLRRVDPAGTSLRTADVDLPEGRRARDVRHPRDQTLWVVDQAGDVWATSNLGRRWVTDDAPHDDDPIRYLTPGMVVHRSGAAHDLVAGTRTLELRPFAPGRDDVDVVRGGAHQDGLWSVTASGEVWFTGVQTIMTGGHPCGRPFEVGGASVVAPTVVGTSWSTALPPAPLPAATRAALAKAWLADAQAEHASVAAFARYTLQLLALGAPAALVEDAQRAMADELRHATDCFSLARRYAGTPLAPGRLPLDGATGGHDDLASVAVAVLREGAIGESIGALLAETRRQMADDKIVLTVLTRIAQDESAHAAMAWRFLAWAVEQGGDPVRDALLAAADAAIEAHLPSGLDGPVPAGWEAHGHLSHQATRRAVRRAVRGVIRPCLRALCSRPSEPGAQPRGVGVHAVDPMGTTSSASSPA